VIELLNYRGLILLLILIFTETQNSFPASNQLQETSYVVNIEQKADSLFSTFKYDSASVYFFTLANLYEHQQNWLPCVKNYRLTSNALIKAAKYDTATYYAQRALDIVVNHFVENNKNEMIEKSDVLLNIANISEKKEKFEQELNYCQRALELTLSTDNSAKPRIASIWNKIGVTYTNLRNYDKALLFCDSALNLRLKLLQKDQNDIAESYISIGKIYLKKEKYDYALEYFQKALKIQTNELNEQHPDIANCYILFGLAYERKEEFNKALEYYKKALIIYNAVLGEKHPIVASVYNNIGIVYEYKGEYDKALEYYQNALKLQIAMFDDKHPDVAYSYFNLGLASRKKGEYNKALGYCQTALKLQIATLGEQNWITADIYDCIGTIYKNEGQYEKALDYCLKALKIRIPILGEQHSGIAASYNIIGVIYKNKGEYDKALEYYQRAVKILYSVLGEEHLKVADIYTNIGVVYETKGEYDKALEYYHKALKICISTLGEEHPEIALLYNNIGVLYLESGDYDKALESSQKALKMRIFFLGEQNPDVAMTYNNIGEVYISKGNNDMALEYFRKALEIRISLLNEKNPNIAYSYIGIGLAYCNKGIYNNALEYYQKALKIYVASMGEKHPAVASCYTKIGDANSKKGEYLKALEYYQKALLSNIPGFHDTSVYSNPKMENVLSKPNLLSNLINRANTFYLLYKNRTKSYSDIKASLLSYELAFQLINTMRNNYNIEDTKLLLSEKTKNYYTEALHVAIEFQSNYPSQENCTKPFEFLEKSKGATMVARFNDYNAKHFASIPDSMLEKEKELRNKTRFYSTQIANQKYLNKVDDTLQIDEYENESFTCSRKLDSLITYFETTYPAYYEFKYANKTVPVTELQKSLDNNTAVLNYFVSDSILFIASVTDSLNKIEEILIDSSFKKLITRYYINIKTAETESFEINSYQIYKKLIEPVQKHILHKEHLIIIPDDYLYYVPFETLIENIPTTNERKEGYSILDYLIKSHSISYQHSATLWYNSIKRVVELAATQKVNFIGYAPVFNKEKNNGLILSSNISTFDTTGNNIAYRSISTDLKKFNPLPYTKDEIVSIVHLFEKHKKEAKAYLYSDANESNFKNNVGNYKYIHIASHGFSNDKEPELSGIVFSQNKDTIISNSDSKEDEILYVGETYNLNLNADLVVLSSCESGLGKLIKGEGLQALSRGFLYTGTPNIIFSIWKTLDKPTKNLMVQFYSNVLDGESYPEALRQTKLKLINDHQTSFPHFWGGFILVGK
jgi:tetratricopeptide (TPR) repeat protein